MLLSAALHALSRVFEPSRVRTWVQDWEAALAGWVHKLSESCIAQNGGKNGDSQLVQAVRLVTGRCKQAMARVVVEGNVGGVGGVASSSSSSSSSSSARAVDMTAMD